MKITLKAFQDGGEIPVEYTCDGNDSSPEIRWEEIPDDAESLLIIMDDPDAPGGTFTHWLVYNISPSLTGIKGGVPDSAEIQRGIHQGLNGFGRIGYGGPCPPRGRTHRYYFRLYATATRPGLRKGARRQELEKEISGKVIEEASYMGTYQR